MPTHKSKRHRSYRHRKLRKNKSRKNQRKYRARGGQPVNFSNYSPVGTINPSVMVPQNYIPFNQNVSSIPYPLSTSNFPLP